MPMNKPPLFETIMLWMERSDEKIYVQQSVLEKFEFSEVEKAKEARRIRQEGGSSSLKQSECLLPKNYRPGVEEYHFLEPDKEKISEMERKVRECMHSPLIRKRLKLVLENLLTLQAVVGREWMVMMTR